MAVVVVVFVVVVVVVSKYKYLCGRCCCGRLLWHIVVAGLLLWQVAVVAGCCSEPWQHLKRHCAHSVLLWRWFYWCVSPSTDWHDTL